jgi:hypothetical protein
LVELCADGRRSSKISRDTITPISTQLIVRAERLYATIACKNGVRLTENSRKSDVRVRDNTLASLSILDDTRLSLAVLLSDQGRDISLESTSAETKCDNTKHERYNGLAAGQNDWNGRDDEQDVTDNRERDGDEDSVETTKIFIGDDGTDNGRRVCPERVELADTKRSTLAHA